MYLEPYLLLPMILQVGEAFIEFIHGAFRVVRGVPVQGLTELENFRG